MRKVEQIEHGWTFYCPACRENHIFDERWAFDGNMEAPTFTPSLSCGPYWRMPPGWDYETAPRDEKGELVRGEGERLLGAVEWTCHLNLTNGVLIFHADSTHEFAGKSVPIEDIPV
jgi:hypothetical protein